MDFNFDQLRQMSLFSDSLVADRAALKAKNEMSAVTLAIARQTAKQMGVDEAEVTKAKNDLGLNKAQTL